MLTHWNRLEPPPGANCPPLGWYLWAGPMARFLVVAVNSFFKNNCGTHVGVFFFIANVLIRCNRPYILLCAHLNMTCRLKISSRIICSNMYWNRIVQVHVLVCWPLSLYVQVVPWPREVLIVQIPISIWIDLFRFLLGIRLICLVPIRL